MKTRLVITMLSALCVCNTAHAQSKPEASSKRLIDLGLADEEDSSSPATVRTGEPDDDATSTSAKNYVELSWAGAYDPAPTTLLEQVRTGGLNAEALRLLADVETPNAVRIMILDAASSGGRAADAADMLMRAWSRGGKAEERLTIDRLSAEQLLQIGYLAARASPKKLAALGGDSEVEKLSPMTLLMAATSRRRGDMTSRVVLALVKAQQAIIEPEEALCVPYLCMKTAVTPFSLEWSVHPEAICRFALAGETTGKGLDPDDPLAFCADERKQTPVFVEQARQEDAERQAAISSPSAPSGGAGMPPGTSSLQQDLAMIDLAIEQLEQERSKMTGLEGVLVDQMIVELRRQRQFIEAHLNGTTPPAPPAQPTDPFGIGKLITF